MNKHRMEYAGTFICTAVLRFRNIVNPREVSAEFGLAWDQYAARTPASLPFVRRLARTIGEESGAHA